MTQKKYIQIEGYGSLKRDLESGAVVADRGKDYEIYLKKREAQTNTNKKIEKIENEINHIKSDINNFKDSLSEIKNLLLELVKNDNTK